jgi:hypothetical protein
MRAMASGPEVVLEGRAMVGLIRAADGLGQWVAVAARLGQAHRGTTHVDAVVDEVAQPDAVEALLELPTARRDPTGAHRVRVAGTKVELIGVGPVDDNSFDGLTEQRPSSPARIRGPGHVDNPVFFVS